MSTTKVRSNDMKFEIVVIPVSDVDRAKEFYGRLGWRLDAEFASGDDFRVIQFTPPGSGCSVIFGKNVGGVGPAVRIPRVAATARLPRSVIQTATDGCSRRSRRGWPGASTPG